MNETVSGDRRRILVVDGSRVVRATLVKHLASDFELIEESNGESAWQTLLLDNRIDAVVSGISPPKLEARELLGRMRGSAVRRVRETPFILIVSDLENPAVADLPDWPGVAGWISKSMGKTALVAELNRLLDAAANLPRTAAGQKIAPVSRRASRLLGPTEFADAVASLAFGRKNDRLACVIVFGIDRLDDLVARFGKAVPEILTSRLAALLAEKVDARDPFGQTEGNRLAIISHGVDLRHGSRFAARVCKSLANGQIAVRGQKIRLTVSAGIASAADDDVACGADLLALALRRLAQAQVCGGNTVCTELRPGCPLNRQDEAVRWIFDALRGAPATLSPARAAAVGLRLLPLLERINTPLSLGLPLGGIKARIAQTVRSSR